MGLEIWQLGWGEGVVVVLIAMTPRAMVVNDATAPLPPTHLPCQTYGPMGISVAHIQCTPQFSPSSFREESCGLYARKYNTLIQS